MTLDQATRRGFRAAAYIPGLPLAEIVDGQACVAVLAPYPLSAEEAIILANDLWRAGLMLQREAAES